MFIFSLFSSHQDHQVFRHEIVHLFCQKTKIPCESSYLNLIPLLNHVFCHMRKFLYRSPQCLSKVFHFHGDGCSPILLYIFIHLPIQIYLCPIAYYLQTCPSSYFRLHMPPYHGRAFSLLRNSQSIHITQSKILLRHAF